MQMNKGLSDESRPLQRVGIQPTAPCTNQRYASGSHLLREPPPTSISCTSLTVGRKSNQHHLESQNEETWIISYGKSQAGQASLPMPLSSVRPRHCLAPLPQTPAELGGTGRRKLSWGAELPAGQGGVGKRGTPSHLQV